MRSEGNLGWQNVETNFAIARNLSGKLQGCQNNGQSHA